MIYKNKKTGETFTLDRVDAPYVLLRHKTTAKLLKVHKSALAFYFESFSDDVLYNCPKCKITIGGQPGLTLTCKACDTELVRV